jgi:hypothetical protein
MQVEDEDFTFTYITVRVTHRNQTLTQRFHLTTGKNNPGFKPFKNMIIVQGLAVIGHNLHR